MTAHATDHRRTWSPDEAQSRLPDLLRLAMNEGPQWIGVQAPQVVVMNDRLYERVAEMLRLAADSLAQAAPTERHVVADIGADTEDERALQLVRSLREAATLLADAAAGSTGPSSEAGAARPPLGQWLLDHLQIGVDLELPDREDRRPVPFADDTTA